MTDQNLSNVQDDLSTDQDKPERSEEQDTQKSETVELGAELNLEEQQSMEKRLKSKKGQIDSAYNKILKGIMDQETYDKLPNYIREGIEEEHPDLFSEEEKSPQIDKDVIISEVEDNMLYKQMSASIPKDISDSQKAIIEEKYKKFRGAGLTKTESLENSLLHAGISKYVEEGIQKGIQIANSSFPIIHEQKSREDSKALNDEYEEYKREMEAVGVSLTKDEFKKAREAGEI